MQPFRPLSIDVSSGLLQQARQVACPNHDCRPEGAIPELIVVHGISLPPGEYGGPWIDRLFTNSLPGHVHPYFQSVADLKVSSHLLIRRDGELVQYVPFHRRAWHAGASNYLGRERCNDFSIGVELEGSDELPYEPEQYARLSDVIVVLCGTYPTLSRDRIAGHNDVSPGRKTDPGEAFDWIRLRAMVRSRYA